MDTFDTVREGIFSVIVATYLIVDLVKGKTRLAQKVDELESYIRDEMHPLIEDCTSALKQVADKLVKSE